MNRQFRSFVAIILISLLPSCSKGLRYDGPEPVDGQGVVIQQAGQGRGIDLVLMGDGYTKDMIWRGDYDKVMRDTMEKFFSEEPFTSLRNLFNVTYIVAISEDDECKRGPNTAFMTVNTQGSHMECNLEQVEAYTSRAIGEQRTRYANMVVVMNDYSRGGTTWMPLVDGCTDGAGKAICAVPYQNQSEFRKILLHEAGGHGFAKLADEYSYERNGYASEATLQDIRMKSPYGFYRNIDIVGDPAKVKWHHMIEDPRYAPSVSVVVGGQTYIRGIYRPTHDSIMGECKDGTHFNAPSREAIYITAHRVAFGDSWQYDFEKFAEFDSVNL